MRLFLACNQCAQEHGADAATPIPAEFRDDGRYQIKCSRGHETIVTLQQMKHEVLFEIGATAILDGYYRDAVASMAASLERFYEFAIRVMLESISKQKNPEAILKSDELFKRTWPQVSNQSERQLGAFVFLWAAKFGVPPIVLTSKQSEFRNAVIHKGKIPTREEAIQFGNDVLDVLRPLMQTIRENCHEDKTQVTMFHLRDHRLPADDGKNHATAGIQMILSKTYCENVANPTTVQKHLERLKFVTGLYEAEVARSKLSGT